VVERQSFEGERGRRKIRYEGIKRNAARKRVSDLAARSRYGTTIVFAAVGSCTAIASPLPRPLPPCRHTNSRQRQRTALARSAPKRSSTPALAEIGASRTKRSRRARMRRASPPPPPACSAAWRRRGRQHPPPPHASLAAAARPARRGHPNLAGARLYPHHGRRFAVSEPPRLSRFSAKFSFASGKKRVSRIDAPTAIRRAPLWPTTSQKSQTRSQKRSRIADRPGVAAHRSRRIFGPPGVRLLP